MEFGVSVAIEAKGGSLDYCLPRVCHKLTVVNIYLLFPIIPNHSSFSQTASAAGLPRIEFPVGNSIETV
jgi:hypothetical protein